MNSAETIVPNKSVETARFDVVLTMFLSAFLLFQIQPQIGKYLLPKFGGTPAIWTTCLLFFQFVLLLGYTYSHFLSVRLPVRLGNRVHLGILTLSLICLPINLLPISNFAAEYHPIATILSLLTTTIGIPYFILATTAPLIQKWYADRSSKNRPYRLYAVSNAGSLTALISYPFVVEPWLDLQTQMLCWSVAYVVFVALVFWVVYRSNFLYKKINHPTNNDARGSDTLRNNRPNLTNIALWVSFSAVGASLLIATTNQMCQEVAAIPFLWVLPLVIYLSTFILCFEYESSYNRRTFGFLFGGLGPVAIVVFSVGLQVPLLWQILTYASTLFVCCMSCNGEVVKIKPNSQHLTVFYLAMSVGGVIGAVFAAVVAPYIFVDYIEYPLLLAICGVMILTRWYHAIEWAVRPENQYRVIGPITSIFLTIIAAVVSLTRDHPSKEIMSQRNFFGVLRVTTEKNNMQEILKLSHGRVIHGSQFTSSERINIPTSYYGSNGAVDLSISRHPKRFCSKDQSLRIGVIGLGVGTIAAHALKGDHIRFYEINPAVIDIANNYFSYIENSRSEIDIVSGDARIQLESELNDGHFQDFDILIIDAFSSDAIPIHLLTVECSEVYWRHLKSDGLLLFHISNQTLDLVSVVGGLAVSAGATALVVNDIADPEVGTSSATWVIVTKNPIFLMDKNITEATMKYIPSQSGVTQWTDDFASIWKVLK